MSEFEKKKVLITVKTYPSPSTKYKETVCTAGITESGEWIRLYPIRYRWLQDSQKYQLFSWIDVSVKKSNDYRVESYKVDIESVKMIRHLDSKKDLEERRNIVLPLLKPSMEIIEEEHRKHAKSLAVFKPKEITNIEVEKTSPSWTKEEIAILNQPSFFDNPKEVKQLKKMPYKFRCCFKCNDEDCNGHRMKIESWEFNWAYFKYLNRYGSEEKAIEMLKNKWMSYFANDKDGYLFVGTTFPNPTFIIIGHFSYPKKNIKIHKNQISFLS